MSFDAPFCPPPSKVLSGISGVTVCFASCPFARDRSGFGLFGGQKNGQIVLRIKMMAMGGYGEKYACLFYVALYAQPVGILGAQSKQRLTMALGGGLGHEMVRQIHKMTGLGIGLGLGIGIGSGSECGFGLRRINHG